MKQSLPDCLSYVVSDCKKDILVLWDNLNFVSSEYFPAAKKFLKKFIKNKKLRVGKQGTYLGFITFSNDNRSGGELLKVGEIKKKRELIQWLDSFDYDNDLNGKVALINKVFDRANNVS